MGVWYHTIPFKSETGMVESLELRKRDKGMAKEKTQHSSGRTEERRTIPYHTIIAKYRIMVPYHTIITKDSITVPYHTIITKRGIWYQEPETGKVESLELRKRDKGVAKEKTDTAFEWSD